MICELNLQVIGKAGWGYLQSQWQARSAAAGSQSPGSGASPMGTPRGTPRTSVAGAQGSEAGEAEVAGTVMIRDVVARTVVAHFR